MIPILSTQLSHWQSVLVFICNPGSLSRKRDAASIADAIGTHHAVSEAYMSSHQSYWLMKVT